ncbi:NADH dehydrogenase (ubiquinone) B18 subunit [Haemaphysalis longicornis]
MGQYYGTLTTTNGNPLMTIPSTEMKTYQPKYDPMLGFPDGRKPREMKATELEMYSAKLDPQGKDYCAHKLIDLYACYRARFPFVTTCKHERHEYDACVYDDYIIRYKEYERERRLKAREERIAKKRLSEQMDE